MEAAWKRLQLDADTELDGEYLISNFPASYYHIVTCEDDCYSIVEELEVYDPAREKTDIHRDLSGPNGPPYG